VDHIPSEASGSAVGTHDRPVELARPTHILLQWIRDNTLVTLTILGVLVYVVFSIPTTYFYARLGTTPSEVGITYATILSGSTFGLVLIISLSLVALYYVFVYLLVVAACFVAAPLLWTFVAHPKLLRKGWNPNGEHFEEKLTRLNKAFRGTPESWQEIAQEFGRGREPGSNEERTSDGNAESKKSHELRIYSRMLSSGFRNTREQFTPHSIKLIGIIVFVYLAIIVGLLTWYARIQSEVVETGGRVFGTENGVFGYHAEMVTLEPDSAADMQSLQQLVGPLTGPNVTTYLLGQNDQYLIVYSLARHETVRIPVSEATVSSVP
jgi:hypothetical protein